MPPTYHLLGEPETIQDGQLGCFHFLSIQNRRQDSHPSSSASDLSSDYVGIANSRSCLAILGSKKHHLLGQKTMEPLTKVGPDRHGRFGRLMFDLHLFCGVSCWVFSTYIILHPWSLTWHLRSSPWKRRLILETITFRGAKYTREVQTIGVEAGKKVIWMESLVSSTKISTPKTKTFSWKHIHFFVFLIGFLLVEVSLFFS